MKEWSFLRPRTFSKGACGVESKVYQICQHQAPLDIGKSIEESMVIGLVETVQGCCALEEELQGQYRQLGWQESDN